MILDIESIREGWSTDGLENAADDNDEIEGLVDEFGLHQLHQSMVGEQQRARETQHYENRLKIASKKHVLVLAHFRKIPIFSCGHWHVHNEADSSKFVVYIIMCCTQPRRGNIDCWTPWKVKQGTAR